jgi:hypothetical protein
MCFIVDFNSNPFYKIADKDIVCYKLLESNYQPFYKSSKPPYKRRKLMPIVELNIQYINGEEEIFHGYHSYIKREEAIRIGDVFLDVDFHICKFIIPKGTKYYQNKNEYVSETIKRS